MDTCVTGGNHESIFRVSFLTKQRLFVNALVVTAMCFFLKHDRENFVLLKSAVNSFLHISVIRKKIKKTESFSEV